MSLSRVSDTLCTWLFDHNLNGLVRIDGALTPFSAEGHYEDHHIPIPTSNHVNCLFQLPAEGAKKLRHSTTMDWTSTSVRTWLARVCIGFRGAEPLFPEAGYFLINISLHYKKVYYIPHGWAGAIISAWPAHQLGPACSLCDSIRSTSGLREETTFVITIFGCISCFLWILTRLPMAVSRLSKGQL